MSKATVTNPVEFGLGDKAGGVHTPQEVEEVVCRLSAVGPGPAWASPFSPPHSWSFRLGGSVAFYPLDTSQAAPLFPLTRA